MRNCYLVSLTDLYGKLDYVRDAVAGYFNHLIQVGVAGIRIDAAKHMWPEVLRTLSFGNFKELALSNELRCSLEKKGMQKICCSFIYHFITES